MRIISSFHDYYDVIQSQDQDRDLIYQRTPRTIESAAYQFPLRGTLEFGFDIGTRVVGFCGRIYPVLVAMGSGPAGSVRRYCHTIDDYDKFVEQFASKKQLERYHSPKYKRKWCRYGRWEVNDLFAKYVELRDAYKGLFEEHSCPIFVADCIGYCQHRRKWRIRCNAKLATYEFYRIIPPAIAYQELCMYMGGMVVPQKPIPTVPDKILAEAKGFDKFSFRKQPSRK